MMDKDTLPRGWVEAELEHIASYIQRGKSPKYTDVSELPVINQKCIRWYGIEKEHLKYIHREQWSKWSEERYLQHLDILWNSTGTGTIGRACIYKRELPKAVVDSHVTILRLYKKNVDPEYVFYFIMSPYIQKKIDDMQAGSTNQVELGRTAICETIIPIPPLNEQHRIVSKIEELFSDLDEGEAALKKAQKLIATYRQSVLKAAVTGELTKDWREANRDHLESGEALLGRILQTRREQWQGRGKYKEPQAPDTTNLRELPEGWVWARMQQLAHIIGGLTKNSKRNAFRLKRPMLRVANVYQNRLELNDVHEIGIKESELERVSLQNGDILIVEGNGSKDQIGRMAIWENQIPDCIHQNHLIKARLVQPKLAKYIITWFMSYRGREIIERVASSTSGLHTLSLSKIDELVVPLPPLEEAEEIVSMVEDITSQIAALENWCETELARSATLRQAILKDAFSGKLIPQDPADEPASVLLERIKSERAAQSKASSKRSRGRREPAKQLDLL